MFEKTARLGFTQRFRATSRKPKPEKTSDSPNTIYRAMFSHPPTPEKKANQLAPVDLKGGSPRPRSDKPAEFVENIVKDLLFVKA